MVGPALCRPKVLSIRTRGSIRSRDYRAGTRPAPTVAYIGLGSNLGNRKKNILRAIEMLSGSKGIEVKRVSTMLDTEPVGPIAQPNYINCVVELRTSLDVHTLLQVCLNIEQRMGRVRTQRWGPRIIDLDILLYGEPRSIDHPRHSRFRIRRSNRPLFKRRSKELSATADPLDPGSPGDSPWIKSPFCRCRR